MRRIRRWRRALQDDAFCWTTSLSSRHSLRAGYRLLLDYCGEDLVVFTLLDAELARRRLSHKQKVRWIYLACGESSASRQTNVPASVHRQASHEVRMRCRCISRCLCTTATKTSRTTSADDASTASYTEQRIHMPAFGIRLHLSTFACYRMCRSPWPACLTCETENVKWNHVQIRFRGSSSMPIPYSSKKI